MSEEWCADTRKQKKIYISECPCECLDEYLGECLSENHSVYLDVFVLTCPSHTHARACVATPTVVR